MRLGSPNDGGYMVDIKSILKTGLSYIKFAPTKDYNDKETLCKYYDEYLDQGLEGAVLRNLDSKYKSSSIFIAAVAIVVFACRLRCSAKFRRRQRIATIF